MRSAMLLSFLLSSASAEEVSCAFARAAISGVGACSRLRYLKLPEFSTRDFGTAFATGAVGLIRISSIRPTSMASSAVNHDSSRIAARHSSTGVPAFFAYIPAMIPDTRSSSAAVFSIAWESPIARVHAS